jgi:hypothetical protein
MRLLGFFVSLLLMSASARAAVPAPNPLVAVGIDSQLSRFGSSYETVYHLNLEPHATLRYLDVDVGVILPMCAGGTVPGYFGRHTLGNATALVSHRTTGQVLRGWSLLSVSAPTSQWTDGYGYTSRLAATAALLSDAGYFLPETTTLRVELGQALAVSRRLELGTSAGAHFWMRSDPGADAGAGGSANPTPEDQIVLPLVASAALDLGAGFTTRVTSRNQVALLGQLDERWLHVVEAAGAYRWASSRVEASLSVPLDHSLLALGMIGVGIAYEWSF